MSLDDRKKRILREIVYLYEALGEPVGSGVLSKHIGLHLSTATLRSEMALLTKLGFLAQPHTSAGRIPSTEGYRYYLDHLMDESIRLTTTAKEKIDDHLDSLDRQTDRLMQGAALGLSEMLGLPTFATMPKGDNMTVAHYRLVQIGLNSVLIVAVGAQGTTHTRVVRLKEKVVSSELDKAANILNSELCFISGEDLERSNVKNAVRRSEISELVREIVLGAVNILINLAEYRVIFEGVTHLSYVTNNGVKLDLLLELMGDRNLFCSLIAEATKTGGVMLNNREDRQHDTSGLAIICDNYHSGGGLSGVIGLIGPERMAYAVAVPTIRYTARRISGILTG